MVHGLKIWHVHCIKSTAHCRRILTDAPKFNNFQNELQTQRKAKDSQISGA